MLRPSTPAAQSASSGWTSIQDAFVKGAKYEEKRKLQLF